MDDLISAISKLVGISENDVERLGHMAPGTYKLYHVPKKSGGQRRILHPSRETKMLQYAAIELLFSTFEIHSAAFGFIKGLKSPLRKNAFSHADNEYLVRVDFRDFFESIAPNDILIRLKTGSEFGSIRISDRDLKFLEKLLFVRRKDGVWALPIGAPSSPIVSNIVMSDVDKKLSHIADTFDSTYTRYADDLIFSTRVKGRGREILRAIQKLLKEISSPCLQLNPKKTHFMSRNCRRVVTGLIITPEGRISIGRSKKRMLRSLLFDAKEGRLESKKRGFLQGYLAYILDVEPEFFDSLALKYGIEMLDGLLRNSCAGK